MGDFEASEETPVEPVAAASVSVAVNGSTVTVSFEGQVTDGGALVTLHNQHGLAYCKGCDGHYVHKDATSWRFDGVENGDYIATVETRTRAGVVVGPEVESEDFTVDGSVADVAGAKGTAEERDGGEPVVPTLEVLASVSQENNDIEAAWLAVEGADGYHVIIVDDEANEAARDGVIVGKDVLTVTFDALTAGEYRVDVTAVRNEGDEGVAVATGSSAKVVISA